MQRLFDAPQSVLRGVIARAEGLSTSELELKLKLKKENDKDKKSGLQVQARTGLPCPICGDIVWQVSYADSTCQCCPTCQTGGKLLANRVLSRLLK